MRSFQTGQGLPVTGVIDAATWPALLRQPIAAPDWNGAGAATATASASGARTGPPSARLPSRRAEIPPLGRGG